VGRFGPRASVRARQRPAADPEAGAPPGFEAVAEALAPGFGLDTSAARVAAACDVVGRALALDGVSLEQATAGLRTTWRSARGCDPTYDAVTALLVAWSDTTLSYLHQLSCEDPLTGLASLAHVRSRVSELCRAAPLDGLGGSHVLVVCEVVERASVAAGDQFTRAMHLAQLGDAARTVFSGPEIIGRVGRRRVVVLTRRDDRLGTRVRLVRTLARDLDVGAHPVRVWIEGLPGTEAGAATLLDELARP
jgi:hypothetical protein